uniref:Uncharacterized protein n=1 Tax=Tanacetum cinerariifolium TaxID=118510 RepID=A0A6L2JKT6_TANCI|nr:hypothetical protein [Tanacetum cinerariifolium]
MFQDILNLQVETPDNPFVTPVNVKTIKAFMNRVGYQGVVDKVSAFYMNSLAQSWHTILKVFNRFFTTRTSGHDQTKINILLIFHAVSNRTNDDYAALLWWDFINNVKQKKEAIHYPRFNKLIIPDLIKKFPEIPKRLKRIIILSRMIFHWILATDDFKEYETVFMNVDVSMNQLQLVVSTQGTHRSTPSADTTPTLTASPQGKKRRERDEIAEATFLSLTLHKTALAAEAQENIDKVQENWQMRRLKRWLKVMKIKSHMGENPEKVNDNKELETVKKDEEIEKEKKDEEIEKENKDDNAKKTDKVVKEKEIVDDVTGSMEIRKEKKQTPIPLPTRSPKNVSSFKKQFLRN